MMRFRPRVISLALSGIAVLWIGVAPAAAQQPLEGVLSFLLTNEAVPTGDFVKDSQSAAITRDTLTRLLLAELTTLPLTSSSPGFTYRFNPTLGTPERTSGGFGPFFTERSLTAGRGQASIDLTVQEVHYTSLDNHDLRDGSFVTTGNQFRDEPAPFDIETLTLDLSSRSVTLSGNLGVTDWLDVGLAIPLVSLSLDGSRVNTYRGARLQQATANASATGLGDIAVRSKVRLLGQRGTGVALIGDVRLPTGRKDDLLGAGAVSFRALVSGSIESGPIAVDVNGGVTTGGVSDEVNYRGAVSLSPSPHLTLVGELLGRRLADVGSIVQSRAPHPTIAGVDTIRLVSTGTSTHTAVAVAGFKWNIVGNWLVNGNVSVPLTASGLRARMVPIVGVAYTLPE
jgi:hypothetical protein